MSVKISKKMSINIERIEADHTIAGKTSELFLSSVSIQ